MQHHINLKRCWLCVKFLYLFVIILAIISIAISPTSSTPTSFSSSSISPSEDEIPNEESDIVQPSKSSSNLDVVFPTMATTMKKASIGCGCDALQEVIDEVRQTKEVCIDTALAVDVHVKKVGRLQIAVDGLASMADTNHADKYVAPTSPSTHIMSSSDGVPSSSSSIELDDIESNAGTSSSPYDDPNDIPLEIATPPSLEGVQLVIMEAPEVIPRDCLEVQQKVGNVTGVYTILPDGCGQPFQVFCDMTTSGGGWTVLQRRLNGELSFARLWGAYRRGFGNLLTEFWLGLDKMSRLTSQDDYELRVELQDFNGTKGVAEYESMMVNDYRSNYRLHVGAFKANGSAGDSLSYHNHMPFTTTDRDNDLAKKNCAKLYSSGGWWFNGCLYSNLNGIYLGPQDDEFATGVTWYEFASFRRSLKLAEMKVRPVP